VPVEVKTARPSKFNGTHLGYQFCLNKPGHTDFRKAKVLILIALGRDGDVRSVYVIPTDVVGQRKKITMPMSLSSKWQHWAWEFEVLARYIGAR